MGTKVIKYENTTEDLLEKAVRKGKSLDEIYDTLNIRDINKICSIIINPNKWNIIHLACWYNNSNLLSEIISNSISNKKDLINAPDINLEPPIAICCVVDSLDCLKILDRMGAKTTFDETDEKYRKDLNLNKLCVYHDAVNCFSYLNPDLAKESEELDNLYDLAKKNGNDRISDLFDNVDVYEDLESTIQIRDEEVMENLD